MPSKGLISRASEITPRNDLKGHLGLKAYSLVEAGKDGSIQLKVILDEIEPGGRIDAHYHKVTPVQDHAYYIISGDILATIGDRIEKVGPDTLLYFPTDVVHEIENIGNKVAKVLLIGTVIPDGKGPNSIFTRR
jgi:mannose-6-phosphate isomerase-like protein (cupin superfamily)